MSKFIRSSVTISQDCDVTFEFGDYEDEIREWIADIDKDKPQAPVVAPNIIGEILDRYKYGQSAKQTLDEIIQYYNRNDIFLVRRMGEHE